MRRQLRVIVVDNGSVDDSVSIAKELADEVRVETKQLPAAARNLGLSLVHTELVLTVDADCRPTSNLWAQTHIAAMVSSPPDVCGAVGPLFPTPSGDWWAMRADITPHPGFGPNHVPLYGVGGNSCYLTSAMRRVGGFPLTWGSDWGLGLRLRSAGFRLLWVEDAAMYHSNREGARAYFQQMRKVGWYAAEADYQIVGALSKTEPVEYAKNCGRIAKAYMKEGRAEGFATFLKVAGHLAGSRDYHAFRKMAS